MHGSKSVTTTVTLMQYNLHVSTTEYGEVTGDPVGIGCGHRHRLRSGIRTRHSGRACGLPGLLSDPNSVAWGGDCNSAQLTCLVTMDGQKTVTATFDPLILAPPNRMTLFDTLLTTRLI
jgi:hypothetical protein